MNLDNEVIVSFSSNLGNNIYQLSLEKPILLVFLRHFGCTFCREALADITAKRSEIEENGTKIVFVHMSAQETADIYFKKYELDGIENISDPECTLYKHFGLIKGSFSQLFGLRVMLRGFQAGPKHGHAGKMIGDGFQMPGVFLLTEGTIRDSYVHKSAADRPDYQKLASCCIV